MELRHEKLDATAPYGKAKIDFDPDSDFDSDEIQIPTSGCTGRSFLPVIVVEIAGIFLLLSVNKKKT